MPNMKFLKLSKNLWHSILVQWLSYRNAYKKAGRKKIVLTDSCSIRSVSEIEEWQSIGFCLVDFLYPTIMDVYNVLWSGDAIIISSYI